MTVQGAAIQGTTFGGRQPISGAKTYLLEATTGGYGQASKSLLTTGSGTDSLGTYVLSNASGHWSISGDYTCDANAQAYLYSLGGDSGSGANSSIGLIAALGQCPGSGTLTFAAQDPVVIINEATTVAAAYAMAGYVTDATHVSSSNTALAATGIANAFANAANLVTLSSGVANSVTPTNLTNSTVPQNEINTLANILAACVNTSSSSSSECSTLFSNAQVNGSSGGQPTDTASAAINIAHNPGNGITALYGLQPGTGAPFQPTLSGQPNDFTVAITYTGGGLNQPSSIAVDASGNVWTTNLASLSEFSSNGAVMSDSSGFTGGGINVPNSAAIDLSGNVWVANAGNGSVNVSEFNGIGSPVSNSGYTGGGVDAPFAIAIDGSGNVWTANASTTVSELSSTGTAISGGSGYAGGGLNGTASIAIDISGNAWLDNFDGNSLSKFSSGGSPITNSSGYTGGGLNQPQGIAIDASGNVWSTNFAFPSSLSELSSSGTAISGSSGYAGGGISFPYGIAIDGLGKVWVTNEGNNSLSELSNTGAAISPSTGYLAPGLTDIYAIAIDGSGNAWVVSQAGSIIEFVGLAMPVVTPVAANLQSPYGTHAVNLP